MPSRSHDRHLPTGSASRATTSRRSPWVRRTDRPSRMLTLAYRSICPLCLGSRSPAFNECPPRSVAPQPEGPFGLFDPLMILRDGCPEIAEPCQPFPEIGDRYLTVFHGP